MKTDYDVIIVGAGPAGASCAKHLVDNGVKTLIIEKRKLPRYKCCSGMYSDRAIEFIKTNFGDIPDSLYCSNKVYNIINGTSIDALIETNTKRTNIIRDKMDLWLLEKSKCEFITEALFLEYSKDDNHKINIKYIKNNKISELKCNYLIGADGANSKVRRQLDKKYKTKNSAFCMQYVFKGKSKIDKNNYYAIFNNEYSDYFFWFNNKNDLVYIGTCWIDVKKNYLDKLIEKIKNKYDADLTFLRKEGCFIENFIGKNGVNFGDYNILLAGESSSVISAFGEGIPSALIMGKEAAESIINNKENNLTRQYFINIKQELKFVKNEWINAQKMIEKI